MLPGEICALCGKNKATLFFQYYTTDGECRNLGICQQCIEEQGIDPESIEGIAELFEFESEDGSPPILDLGTIPEECPRCKRSIAEVLNSGLVGCEQCYAEYKALIVEALKETRRASAEKTDEKTSDASTELRRRLAEAVAEERYEDAAALRDALEEGDADE